MGCFSLNNEDFVNLSRNLGQEIIQSGSYYWIIQKNKTALSCPPEAVVFPTSNDIKGIFKRGIRAISFRTESMENNFFEYLFIGNTYLLENFDRKVRNRIKKGMNYCIIKTPTIEDLNKKGLEINRQTNYRQERDEQMLTDQHEWENCVATLFNAEDVFIRGAYIERLLVAYAVFIKVNNRYYIYYPYMNRDYSSYCPMNAIYFLFINERIEKEGMIHISAGLSSYVEKKDLDRFKTNMLFEMIPCTRILAISPKIAAFINPVGHWLLKKGIKMKLIHPRLLVQYEILMANKNKFNTYLQERAHNVSISAQNASG